MRGLCAGKRLFHVGAVVRALREWSPWSAHLSRSLSFQTMKMRLLCRRSLKTRTRLAPGPTSTHDQAKGQKACSVAIPDEAAAISAGTVEFSGIVKACKTRTPSLEASGFRPFPRPKASSQQPLIFQVQRRGRSWSMCSLGMPNPGNRRGCLETDIPPAACGLNSTKIRFRLTAGTPDRSRMRISTSWQCSCAWMILHATPTMLKDGFLRIRAKYDPNMIDPAGRNRKWGGGRISSLFPTAGQALPFARLLRNARALTYGCGHVAGVLAPRPRSGPERRVEIDLIEAP
jgi:hypothetical protein